MNRLQEFLDNPHIITGTATVAADPQLTLIAANKALYTLVGETAESCRQQGNSLLHWIEQSSAVRLIGLLAGHPPLFDWEGVLVRKDATSVRIRLSGTRMEGVLHEGQYPVYLSAFTDLACVEEMLSVISLASTEICQTSEESAAGAAAVAGAFSCAAQPAAKRRNVVISTVWMRIPGFFKFRYLVISIKIVCYGACVSAAGTVILYPVSTCPIFALPAVSFPSTTPPAIES